MSRIIYFNRAMIPPDADGPAPAVGGPGRRRDPCRGLPRACVRLGAGVFQRYWPVLVAVSIARPDSLPLPLMSVRM
jgi:hypothetical protein